MSNWALHDGKEEWIAEQLQNHPKANQAILQFIADFKFRCGFQGEQVISKTFRSGYCYYFAHMLKHAFNRGIVCYAYYEGHFVWLDGDDEDDDIAYDVNGVNKDWEHLIPEDLLGDGILDFKHIKGQQSNMDDQQIIKLLLDIIENKQYAKREL